MKVWVRATLIAAACVAVAVILIYKVGFEEASRRPAVPVVNSSQNRRITQSLANMPWTKKSEYHEMDLAKPMTPGSNVPGNSANWRSMFKASHNYFAFVKRAANAAFHGDGDAALYVSRAVNTCGLETALFGKSSNPQAAFQTWLETQTKTPEPMLEEYRRRFQLCRGFFGGNAFASLPARNTGDGYLSASYWRGLAYKDGNPVAEVFHVATELRGFGGSEKTIATAQRTLVNAISSGNPAAVFRAGLFLSGGRATSRDRAFAVAIAGCDLGYDCSTDNPVIFGSCAELGQCTSGLTFADIVQKSIGSSGYARAYAEARQLEQAISRGDKAAVADFVHVKR